MLKQHEVCRALGDINGLIDRDADIRGMQRRRVVDPIAEIADDMSALLQRQDDPLLLVGIDLREHGGPFGNVPQSLVAQLVQLMTAQNLR